MLKITLVEKHKNIIILNNTEIHKIPNQHILKIHNFI